MSNHQKEAGIAEFIGPLLNRIKLAKERVPKNSEMEKFINQIGPEVVKTKDFLNCRQKLDKELVGYLGKIERQIDSWIDHESHEKASDLPKKDTITEVGESSNTSCQMDEVSKVQEFKALLDSLASWERDCLESLIMFPKNKEVKKRLVIYWWVLNWTNTDTAERLISKLIDKEVLIPVYRKHNYVIDRFKIESTFYKWFISHNMIYGSINSEKTEEGTWRLYVVHRNKHYSRILLNLDQRYLNSKDIMDISCKHDDLWVVQLGSWCYTPLKIQETGSKEIKSKDHIEVDQIDFLKKLGKGVRYLSLQGISGITEIPESIGKSALMILDLSACHNLEKLPEKPIRSTLIQRIIRWGFHEENRWFENLRVLDISECYLLDHMPKWICELPNLIVLKGFVVSKLGNKNLSCQLGNLSKLQFLKKLSIRFTNDILDPQVFQGFNSLNCLSILTITWGENKCKELPTYSLPKSLEKLDIRCYPEAELSKWKNPEELKDLKRLYIRGVNLIKIPYNFNWKVEILRIRFLKKLVPTTNWNEIRGSFQNLKYFEYVGCRKPKNFPNYENSWSKYE